MENCERTTKGLNRIYRGQCGKVLCPLLISLGFVWFPIKSSILTVSPPLNFETKGHPKNYSLMGLAPAMAQ